MKLRCLWKISNLCLGFLPLVQFWRGSETRPQPSRSRLRARQRHSKAASCPNSIKLRQLDLFLLFILGLSEAETRLWVSCADDRGYVLPRQRESIVKLVVLLGSYLEDTLQCIASGRKTRIVKIPRLYNRLFVMEGHIVSLGDFMSTMTLSWLEEKKSLGSGCCKYPQLGG